MGQHDKVEIKDINFEPVTGLRVSAYTIPTDFPESDGTLEWDSTTIVIVEVNAGSRTGIGYTYSDKSAAVLIKEKLSNIIKNQNAFSINTCWNQMVHSVRNAGSRGIAANAISAVDCALWDLKAKLLDVPLVTLLGQVRDNITIYGSGGFTSYSVKQLQVQFAGWVDEGITKCKMKIGREPDKDVNRVKSAREAIGKQADLFVDANGAYSAKQAINEAIKFSEYNISWFEEPASSDDLAGLKFIKEKVPSEIQVAAGEYGYDLFYFRRMLEEKSVDVLQADATRCLGITGFLKAAGISEAYSIPLSAHTAPSIHLHPCCALLPVQHIEYFHDHVRIEEIFFDGFRKQQNGKMFPDLSKPGIGIELREKDIEEYLVYHGDI